MMKKGEIWLVKFIEDASVGHEYVKDRPVLVIENNAKIRVTTVVTIMPLTSSNKKHSDDILIKKDSMNRLYKDSLVKVHHVVSFDKDRFVHKIGQVDKFVMDQVAEYLRNFELRN